VLDIVHPGHAQDLEARVLLEAEQIITRLGLDPDADFATLSGGTRRRVLLAHALLGSPDLVLLDEPTNHLDVDSIAWLESFLLRTCRTFLFVTHDRAFLRRLASRILELDRGKLRDWTCDYDTFLRRSKPKPNNGPPRTRNCSRKRPGCAAASRPAAPATRGACATCSSCARNAATAANTPAPSACRSRRLAAPAASCSRRRMSRSATAPNP
jgi:ATPase subunit of ABC transporter with duplicated ATPase domains